MAAIGNLQPQSLQGLSGLSGSTPGLPSIGQAGTSGINFNNAGGQPSSNPLAGLGLQNLGGGAPQAGMPGAGVPGMSSDTLGLMQRLSSTGSSLSASVKQTMADVASGKLSSKAPPKDGSSGAPAEGAAPAAAGATGTDGAGGFTPSADAATGTDASSGSTGAPPTGPINGNVEQWIDQAIAILVQSGIPAEKLDKNAIRAMIQHESGGNPKAQNNWDSNAQKGTPSKGIMQCIDSTFNEHKLPGCDDIWNPVHNIVAAVRYSLKRYGSMSNVPGIKNMAKGGGYKGY